jgi:hypothetical protein
MDEDSYRPLPKVLQLYLEISQYPVLSRTIRRRMRQELFSRGIVSEEAFEGEVLQKAIESQKREGLINPLHEESPQDWDKRVRYIRAHLGDFYFAYNLPHSLFEQILTEVVKRRVPDREINLTFNPEIAPWDLLFAEGERYMQMPEDERSKVKHHLREIIVVLVKSMISDHLSFLRMAKEVFSIYDLKEIRARRIGRGKIGGKAAGMLLAWKLLQTFGEEAGIDLENLSIPDSYYVASDVFYQTHEYNEFHQIMNQKYKSREEIISEYPDICAEYVRAKLPPHILEDLRDLMMMIGPSPLIFRSSSLLEDSFTTAFAGKYDSYFLPNQGTPEQNLLAAEHAILRIYASTLSPDALIYRQRMGLVDFDERMAVLGTRAVDRVDNDYPRMIALSHPHLRPESRVEQLRQYSQRLIDVLDTTENSFKTLPIGAVIEDTFPALRLVAAQDAGDHLQEFISKPAQVDPARLVYTFDPLTRTEFPEIMRNLMAFLENQYGGPVDIEYAVEVTQTWPKPAFHISLLQCRPLSQHLAHSTRRVPHDIPLEQQLFTANRQIPHGVVEEVRYIVCVQPEAYMVLRSDEHRREIGRAIGRINERLKDEEFVLMGPGRWGSSNIQLGVKVSYADIYNSRALIEIAYSDNSSAPEMAYGTHFFQDLVEARIFPLALFPRDDGVVFNWDFFGNAPNCLPDLLPDDSVHAPIITVIDVPAFTGGCVLDIVMDADEDEAMGFLRALS